MLNASDIQCMDSIIVCVRITESMRTFSVYLLLSNLVLSPIDRFSRALVRKQMVIITYAISEVFENSGMKKRDINPFSPSAASLTTPRSYCMVYASVREDNPRALASRLSPVQTQNHTVTCNSTLNTVRYLTLNIGISIGGAAIKEGPHGGGGLVFTIH